MSGDLELPAVETSPRHVRRLIGHDDAWKQVSDAWESGRFAHAWLITGPRGIGKASFAYTMAKAILCRPAEVEEGGLFGAPLPQGLSRDLDETHPALARIESGAHLDLLTVEIGWTDDKMTKRRSEIVVEDTRAVGGFLSKTPAEGGWRVVIVDAADDMNRNAANALLKVLEEPPKRAVLILLAHNPGRLLPTIRSRCRRLALAPLAEADVVAGLRRFLPEESAERLAALAAISQGSLGEALALAHSDGDAILDGISRLLGSWPRLDASALLSFAATVTADDETYRVFTMLLSDWIAALASGETADRTPAEAAARRAMRAAVPLDQWVEVWEKVNHLFRRADAVYLDRRHVVLSAFHAMASPAAAS